MKIESLLTTMIIGLVVFSASAQAPELDTQKIEKLTGGKGTYNDVEKVFKVAFPRNDVKISVDKVQMAPFMGFTSWASFMKGKKAEVMVMGDLVVFEDEVNSVMSILFDSGINVTALHNHFFFDDPKVFFMHIAAEGRTDDLATGVRRSQEKVKEIRTSSPSPAKSFDGTSIPEKSSITPEKIEQILNVKGQAKDGMYKVVIGRKTNLDCGCALAKDMGINTWMAFAGSDENALVCGDFAVLESELQDVLRTLRKGNINIVAIHNHMTGENPRFVFLHYWGRGKTAGLAGSLRAALEKTKD